MTDTMVQAAQYRSQAAGLSAHMDAISAKCGELEDQIDRLDRAYKQTCQLEGALGTMLSKANCTKDSDGWHGSRVDRFEGWRKDQVWRPMDTYGRGLVRFEEHLLARRKQVEAELAEARTLMGSLGRQLSSVQDSLRRIAE